MRDCFLMLGLKLKGTKSLGYNAVLLVKVQPGDVISICVAANEMDTRTGRMEDLTEYH